MLSKCNHADRKRNFRRMIECEGWIVSRALRQAHSWWNLKTFFSSFRALWIRGKKQKFKKSSFFRLGEPAHWSRQILFGVFSTYKITESHGICARWDLVARVFMMLVISLMSWRKRVAGADVVAAADVLYLTCPFCVTSGQGFCLED